MARLSDLDLVDRFRSTRRIVRLGKRSYYEGTRRLWIRRIGQPWEELTGELDGKGPIMTEIMRFCRELRETMNDKNDRGGHNRYRLGQLSTWRTIYTILGDKVDAPERGQEFHAVSGQLLRSDISEWFHPAGTFEAEQPGEVYFKPEGSHRRGTDFTIKKMSENGQDHYVLAYRDTVEWTPDPPHPTLEAALEHCRKLCTYHGTPSSPSRPQLSLVPTAG